MPYTKETLENYGARELKNIFNAIAAHKSALTKYKNIKYAKDEREKAIRKENRDDLLLGEQSSQYKKLTLKQKRDYIIDKILKVKDEPFMKGSLYEANDIPDYQLTFPNIENIKSKMINHLSGYVGLPQEAEKPKEEAPKEEAKEEQPKFSLEKFKQSRNKKFNDYLSEFDDKIEQLKELKPTPENLKDGSYKYAFEELNKELLDTVRVLSSNANKKDASQISDVKERMNEYSEEIKKSISTTGAKTTQVSEIKEGMEKLKKIEDRPEGRFMKEDMKPAIQYIEDVERLQGTPEISLESEQKNVFTMESAKAKTRGDENIGNVRAIGIAPMSAPAREAEVIPPPSERAKSLRRFANFRWVYSNQNSDLGCDSPFQRIQDQEDKRKFQYCYLPTNKLPKPETLEDLNAIKSFNTYPLVPSQSLCGIMQPAGELSFKSSTNPNARKITIDEKQFANTKLYNFEPTQINIKSNNPFSAMYGMQPLDQIKRNPNIQANTLEFSSVMYDDCPLERIKNKYRNKIIT